MWCFVSGVVLNSLLLPPMMPFLLPSQSYVRFATSGCAEKLLKAAATLGEKMAGVSFSAVSGQCWLKEAPHKHRDVFLLSATSSFPFVQRKRRRTTSGGLRLLASSVGVGRKRSGHEGRIRSEAGNFLGPISPLWENFPGQFSTSGKIFPRTISHLQEKFFQDNFAPLGKQFSQGNFPPPGKFSRDNFPPPGKFSRTILECV